MHEFEFIKWIYRQAQLFDPSVVEVGPGDDCAVLRLGGERLLVTADQALDGVHFSLAKHGPAAAGRKAAARNLSDIAAMAGKPLAMVATLAAPKGFTIEQAQEVYRGLRSAGDEFDCPLVGGDVAAWADTGALQVSVTVLGRSAGIVPVLRGGAKVGDAICVTGALGGAWSSGRDLTFQPRIREARVLASRCPLSAMIDISDGLAADLGHVCTASGVGAELDAAAIPIHPDAAQSADPLQAALHDGEDYELLFALPAEAAKLLPEVQPGVAVTRIGTISSEHGIRLLRGDKRETIQPKGWEHKT